MDKEGFTTWEMEIIPFAKQDVIQTSGTQINARNVIEGAHDNFNNENN